MSGQSKHGNWEKYNSFFGFHFNCREMKIYGIKKSYKLIDNGKSEHKARARAIAKREMKEIND